MDRPFFAEGDHFFRERPNCFGFRQRRADALMLDQAANLICQQSFPMLGRASELYRFLLVSHRELADARWLLRARTIGAGSDIDSNRRFHQTGIKFHSHPSSRAVRLSFISLSDFLPKFRYFNISSSVFWASWPTVVILALFRQLAARTLSSISFTLMLRSFFSFMFSSLTPAGVSSNSITSSLKLTKTSR